MWYLTQIYSTFARKYEVEHRQGSVRTPLPMPEALLNADSDVPHTQRFICCPLIPKAWRMRRRFCMSERQYPCAHFTPSPQLLSSIFSYMKQNYQGLSTRRVAVECQPLLQNSNQKIKAKTKVEDWQTENKDVEFGISNELSGTMQVTPIEP